MSAVSEREKLAAVSGYRPALDGLRGLAALWVLVYHCWIRTGAGALDGLGPLGPVVRMGTLGVEVFFVLSGCVLALRLIERPGSAAWWPFVMRRAARLFPAVWVALAAAVATTGLHQSSTDALHRALTPESIVANGTLLAGLARLIPGYQGAVGFVVDPVVWSLTPELLFSLVIAAVLPMIRRWPAATIAALLVAGVALRSAEPSLRLLSVASPLLTGFPLGVAAALVLERAPTAALRRWAPALVALGIIALLVVVETRATGTAGALKDDFARSPFVPVLVALGCAALCVGMGIHSREERNEPSDHAPGDRDFTAVGLSEPMLNRLLGSRPLVALGRWSYGIYLWHFPIIGTLVWSAGLPADGTNRSLALAFVIATPLSIAAGAASYRLIEQPSRRWAARRTSPVGAAGR